MERSDMEGSGTDATVDFDAHRQTLFGVAYRMLGTVADAEDVVQETWLSWSRADRSAVEKPRAYLIRIVVNHALKRLDGPARRHETYPGPWLPEPLPGDVLHGSEDAADAAVRADEVSLAMMVVLETLSPLERAVFILRETFGYEYAEIAGMLGRSAVAVRQAAHRAREHVQARRPRYRTDPDARRAVTQRFMDAAAGGDIGQLLELLDPDVELWTDGGGAAKAARNVIRGQAKVGRFLSAVIDRDLLPADATYEETVVNGDPGMAVRADGTTIAVAVFELDAAAERIRSVYAIVNPDKLRPVD